MHFCMCTFLASGRMEVSRLSESGIPRDVVAMAIQSVSGIAVLFLSVEGSTASNLHFVPLVKYVPNKTCYLFDPFKNFSMPEMIPDCFLAGQSGDETKSRNILDISHCTVSHLVPLFFLSDCPRMLDNLNVLRHTLCHCPSQPTVLGIS